MRMRRALTFFLSVGMACGLVWAEPPSVASDGLPAVTIAVVRDGPSPGMDLVPDIREELTALAREQFRPVFKEEAAFDAGWDASRAGSALDAALSDPSVDMILVTGALTAEAARRADLKKPVISAVPQRPDLYGIFEEKNGRSARENLTFVVVPERVLTGLVAFKNMVQPKVMYVVLQQEYADHVTSLREEISRLETAVGVSLRILPIGPDGVMPNDTSGEGRRAIVLGRLPRLTPDQRRHLIAAVDASGIPSFSILGRRDVENGALAARLPRYGIPIVRRLALDLFEIGRGTPADRLPVELPVEPTLLINGKTARQIGWEPRRELLVTAQFLHPEALRLPEKPLSLAEAFRMATEHNVSLQIAGQQIETAEREKELAKTTLMPQLSLEMAGEHRQIPGLTDIIPDTIGQAGVQFDQMIFDDRSVSRYNSAKRIVEGTKQAFDVSRLDMFSRAGQAFYAYVLERVLARVDHDNLMLTRENLSLARVRMEAGYSGKDEVYRWESENAKRESRLLLRQGEVETARIRLNRVLGIDQSERWEPEEKTLDPNVFPLAGGGLDVYVKDLPSLRRLSDAMVAFAERNAPEMRVLDERIAALEIQLGERKRRWYVPVFSLSGAWGYRFHQSPDIPGLQNDRYVVGIYGSYPLFLGGRRSEEIARVRSELETLKREQERERQDVERRTRTAMQRVAASFPVIRLSRQAADSAGKNFAVVQDKYTQGLVGITDLLEAQNEVFVTEQSASASVYRFMSDLIDLQRAISWFEDEKNPEERIEFVGMIGQLMEEDAGGVPATEGEENR